MHISSFMPFALSVAPAVVSAAGSLGFALGAKNADGSCKSTTDYEADFDALKGSTSLVRVYAASQCNTSAEIIPAAKSKSIKVMLGVWYAISSDALLSDITTRKSLIRPCL
jgi:glucan 1,3-beta-glucosidase